MVNNFASPFHCRLKCSLVIGIIKKCESENVSHSVASDSVTPWTVVRQAPLCMEFSRQEHWSGQPFPSPGDLPDPGIEPRSPILQTDSLPSEPPGKPQLKKKCETYSNAFLESTILLLRNHWPSYVSQLGVLQQNLTDWVV